MTTNLDTTPRENQRDWGSQVVVTEYSWSQQAIRAGLNTTSLPQDVW